MSATLLPISVGFGNLTNFVVRNCTLERIVSASSGYGDLFIFISQWQLENLYNSEQNVLSLISIIQDYQKVNATIIDSISYVNGNLRLFSTISVGVYQFSNIYAENIQGSTTTTSFEVFFFSLSSYPDGLAFNMEFTNITCQGWDYTFGSSFQSLIYLFANLIGQQDKRGICFPRGFGFFWWKRDPEQFFCFKFSFGVQCCVVLRY